MLGPLSVTQQLKYKDLYGEYYVYYSYLESGV